MLEELLSDEVSASNVRGQAVFSCAVDYEKEYNKRNLIVSHWAKLNEKQQREYKNQRDFELQNGVLDFKDPSLIPAKNYMLVAKEAAARIAANNDIRLLSIDGLDFDDSVLEMAESIENTSEIRELYKHRKKTVGKTKNSGIDADEAQRLKNCLSQGRELFMAGKNGSLMVKPLNFFYALTAYSYAIIVLNSPIRYSKKNLPGSHGMAYLPDIIQAQFGGDTARGTFSELVTSFPTQLIKTAQMETQVDCIESLQKFYEVKYNVGLGALLSMIPEMAEYYKLTTGKNSRCHPLHVINANDMRSVKWEFHIGNGEHRPAFAEIENAFAGFHINDRFGKIVISVPATEAHKIKACIYTDIRGGLWFVENPFSLLYFLKYVCISS